MTDAERREFLSAGTRTGVLSTVRADGRPHAAPIWFVLDTESAPDVVVFLTGSETVKGRNLRRTGQAVLTVDVSEPPYSFATITGDVEIIEDPDALLAWSIRIAERYMGTELAESFGRRNAVPGELLLRLTPEHIVAMQAVSD